MDFPVQFTIGDFKIHAHPVLEITAYLLGFALYRRLRRTGGDLLPPDQRLWVVVVAILGAAFGSKIVFWLQDPAATIVNLSQPHFLVGGKTIAGALAGGLFAVEILKKRMGIRIGTGDLFVYPLILAMCIGRVGCFLTGLEDHTHGIATTLPWGVDFGDGIARHPTQLYEIVWLAATAVWAALRARRPYLEGDLFRGFLFAYMAFRLAVDAIKPGLFLAGLTAIQWACLFTMLYLLREVPRIFGIYRVVRSDADRSPA